ncbi:MAG: Rne/Rng family ribonuclease [Chloroherpetonaceae bacterium]|nr:Rne/Rng family ribonuclease [Chloroherpetonaceae bacterium]
MKKQLIIHQHSTEIQVAIVEDGRLAELLIERPENARTVGDIYLGRVQKVVEGLQAAFVDIGQDLDGFLHFSDVGTTGEDYRAMMTEEFDDEDDDDDDDDYDDDEPKRPQGGNGRSPQKSTSTASPVAGENQGRDREAEARQKRLSYTQMIAGKLKPNDSILVQVIKERISTKGSRLTSDITIAGRFMVLLPFGQGNIAVSKRISNRRERKRLKNIVRSMLPKTFGAIIRTVAEEQDEVLLRTDMEMLLNKWKQIEEKLKTAKPPQLIFKEDAITLSALRDYLNDDVSEIVCDSPSLYKESLAFVRWAAPEFEKRMTLYKGKLPVFESYGIVKDVESIFSRKVWLKSGGYLIIEHTEAMVVVDVNSGRYAAKKEQEENSLRTNLEAAKEIARQLRLRDIGGIIVIDFIDLLDDRNAKKVYEAMKTEMRRDRAKSNVIPMSDFGIMQITRERVRPSLMQRMGEQCSACGGTGKIQARRTTVHQVERWLRKFALRNRPFTKLDLTVSPTILEPLMSETLKPDWKWFLQHLVIVDIKPDDSLRSDDFRFQLKKTGQDITTEYGML